MNYRLVLKYLGHFSVAIALLMLPSAGWAVWFQEWGALGALSASIGITLVCAAVLMLLGYKAADRMFQREGLALVGIGWLLAAGFGALPYVFGSFMFLGLLLVPSLCFKYFSE